MESLTENIVRSLDGSDVALRPFLPKFLQDLCEIGSSAETMLALKKKHALHLLPPPLRILNLGCGKGAISIPIARALGSTVMGIDAVPEFIAVARQKASEWQVAPLCSFQVGDIRMAVHSLTGFTLIILGSIGPVFGNIAVTLRILKNCLLPGGYLLLDDGYIPDASHFTHPNCQKKREYLAQIHVSDFTLRDEWVVEHESICTTDDTIYRKIYSLRVGITYCTVIANGACGVKQSHNDRGGCFGKKTLRDDKLDPEKLTLNKYIFSSNRKKIMS